MLDRVRRRLAIEIIHDFGGVYSFNRTGFGDNHLLYSYRVHNLE